MMLTSLLEWLAVATICACWASFRVVVEARPIEGFEASSVIGVIVAVLVGGVGISAFWMWATRVVEWIYALLLAAAVVIGYLSMVP